MQIEAYLQVYASGKTESIRIGNVVGFKYEIQGLAASHTPDSSQPFGFNGRGIRGVLILWQTAFEDLLKESANFALLAPFDLHAVYSLGAGRAFKESWSSFHPTSYVRGFSRGETRMRVSLSGLIESVDYDALS